LAEKRSSVQACRRARFCMRLHPPRSSLRVPSITPAFLRPALASPSPRLFREVRPSCVSRSHRPNGIRWPWRFHVRPRRHRGQLSPFDNRRASDPVGKTRAPRPPRSSSGKIGLCRCVTANKQVARPNPTAGSIAGPRYAKRGCLSCSLSRATNREPPRTVGSSKPRPTCEKFGAVGGLRPHSGIAVQRRCCIKRSIVCAPGAH